MRREEPKILKKSVVAVISIILILSQLFASGSAKPGSRKAQAAMLKEIDGRIANHDYNEALKLLNDFVRDYPDGFEAAEKRISKIMKSRERLKELAEELIRVIEEDPENDEKKLELIREIENLEINPSQQMVAFLASTRSAAEFAVNRVKFQHIMQEGSALAKEGLFAEGVRNQLTGFDVYYDTFLRENDEATVRETNRRLDQVRANAELYAESGPQAMAALEKLKAALVEGSLAQSQSAMQDVERAFEPYLRARNIIAETGCAFRDTWQAYAAENHIETEASYLPFAYRFILGSTSDPESGIIGIIDREFTALLEDVKPFALSAVRNALDNSRAIQLEGTTEEVSANSAAINRTIEDADGFLSIAGELNDLYTRRSRGTDLFERDPFPEYSLAVSDIRNTLTWLSGLVLNDGTYQRILAEFAAFPFETELAKSGARAEAGDYAYLEFLLQRYGTLSALSEAFEDYQYALKGRVGNTRMLPLEQPFEVFVTRCATWGEHGGAEVSAGMEALYAQIVSYAGEAGAFVAVQAERERDSLVKLLNEDLSPDVPSYPQQVVAETASFSEKLAVQKAALATANDSMRLVVRAEDGAILPECLARIATVEAEFPVLLSKAEERITLAERAWSEGQLRYAEAEQAMRREDFTGARSSLERASAKYAESLLYREVVALRAESDSRLAALGAEINRRENEVVVREVRDLKNRARTAYYAGSFEQAENWLQQAKSRWAVTNVDEDAEITQLLAMVGTALSMKTGRTISPSMPLYPEMSQTLSLANYFYEEGSALLKSGKRDDAFAHLESARQKIREVQLVYPLNQEASLLSLRINQLIDPETFNTFFAQKVREARTDYKNPAKQREVYTDLLDLYEINPRYPGLKDFIYTVEIELGIRKPPVDRTAERQAENLYNEALSLYNRNSRDEIILRSALSKVNDALEKNPDNTNAQTLKDRINIALGGSGTVVLPSEAESQYQRAVQELQRGNTIQAAAIVMNLMQNPNYAKSAKILDLKKKVDSLL